MTDAPNSSQRQEADTFPTPKDETPFIEMRRISKRFGGVRALTNVNFTVLAAEIHCLAGENGCGKSTLIKILSGVHAPNEGEIILEGKAHSHLWPAARSALAFRSYTRIFRCFPTSQWLKISRSATK